MDLECTTEDVAADNDIAYKCIQQWLSELRLMFRGFVKNNGFNDVTADMICKPRLMKPLGLSTVLLPQMKCPK